MLMARDQLTKADAIVVAAIEAAVPTLVSARDLIDHFQSMIRSRNGAALDPWIADASSSLLSSFARGITDDRSAVVAAIVEPWSNGQTEGQITKLKVVKRQMYGPCQAGPIAGSSTQNRVLNCTEIASEPNFHAAT
jgi:transposase